MCIYDRLDLLLSERALKLENEYHLVDGMALILGPERQAELPGFLGRGYWHSTLIGQVLSAGILWFDSSVIRLGR